MRMILSLYRSKIAISLLYCSGEIFESTHADKSKLALHPFLRPQRSILVYTLHLPETKIKWK